MMGVHPDAHNFRLPVLLHDETDVADLPENFDSRVQWPNCPTINEIRDQVRNLICLFTNLDINSRLTLFRVHVDHVG